MREGRAPPPSCYPPRRGLPCPQCVFVQNSRTSTSAVAHPAQRCHEFLRSEVLYFSREEQSTRAGDGKAHTGALRRPPPAVMVFYTADSPLMVNFIVCRGLIYGEVNASRHSLVDCANA